MIKTIHIPRWYADETNRRRLNRQINKGEALHSLRSHLCYANQGEIRERQDEQLHNQVGYLNLVTNEVIAWNSVYIEKVVQQLKQEGKFPGDKELKHIWPTRHALAKTKPYKMEKAEYIESIMQKRDNSQPPNTAWQRTDESC